jgi:hypothetical protein
MAVSRITGTVPVSTSERHSDRPSSPGIMMSSTIRSTAADFRNLRACAALSATEARNPLLRR